ncbi:MAG: hypothetical protein K0U24_05585 [Gammaproteobacteria bacterium]|nr:hypothetical protein [Gammaproteobacteria bacterium]
MIGCTIKLLLYASDAAYYTGHLDANNQGGFAKKNPGVTKAGYSLDSATQDKDTGLVACCLQHEQIQGLPIVIAFKGTSIPEISLSALYSNKDLAADVSILIRHKLTESHRQAAFDFYNEVRQKNPGREIVITGHSLGGNLAQDVRVYALSKALEEDKDKDKIFVRTFNPAPLRTQEGDKIKSIEPSLLNYFANYRLSADFISSAKSCLYNFFHWYGDSYTFDAKKELLEKNLQAHYLPDVEERLSKEVLDLQIGSTADKTAEEARVLEQVTCLHRSYESRINGRYFSWASCTGKQNLEAFNLYLPMIKKCIEAGIEQKDFKQIKNYLNTLDQMVSGDVSKGTVRSLNETVDRLNIKPDTLTKSSLKRTKGSNGDYLTGRSVQSKMNYNM